MSGAEVLGILLGVFPLFISAIEHYEDILGPFRRYRHFTSKAQRICDELETERAIFYAECRLLLELVAPREAAIDMMEDLDHSLWRDAGLSEKLAREFGSLGTPCKTTISRINGKLVEIDNKTKALVNELGQPTSQNKRDWIRTRKNKLKFAISEGTLKTTIDELKSLNKTFLTISSQVGRFKTYSLRSNEGSQRIAPAKSKLEAITKFRAIQKASRLLYEALGRACAIHSQHSALLCLAPSCLDPCLNVGIYRIRFTLAIAPFHEAASSGNVDVPNDAIEASSNILEGITTMRISEDPLKSSCSPVSSSASQSSWLEIESLIKDQMVSSQGLILLEQATGALRQAQINQMGANETISRYVRVHEDLCARLHLTISPLDTSSRKAVEVLDATPTSNSDSSSEFYIGTFEDPEICQHHLYCKQGNQSIAADEQYATLAQVISSRLNNRQVGGISQFQRLCIAKHLAVAVLQYHTTPWLSGAWQSSNIVLRNAIPNNDKTVASSLFINARVAKALRTQDPPLSSSSSLHTRDVAPNSVLFALGVMMIEIAYSASFQSLLEPQDYDISPDTRLVNFYAAQRLASNVGVYLGAGFATIIKQCLRCDFGCGEDLNSPGLQEQFYAKVICRLDGLEEGFRKLQSDS